MLYLMYTKTTPSRMQKERWELDLETKQPFGGKVYKAAKGHQPIDSDWPEECDHFAIDWMCGDPDPTAVLELLSCSCLR